MNDLRNAAAGICPLKLSERLVKCRLDTIEPQDPLRPKSIQYKQMAADMLDKAQKNGRDFLKDIFDLILIFISQGNNIDKMTKGPQSDRKRQNLITMRKVYNLKKNCPFYECSPTLSRIGAAFPHVTLVLSDMMRARSGGPQWKMWVKDCDLGAAVHDHFKMCYFPGLIDLEGFSFKAQVGLLLYNLCNARSITISSQNQKTIVLAFIASCQLSSGIIEQRMAPLQARKMFTEFIETLNLDSQMLYSVWNTVVGENYIPINSITLLTHFHEKVLRAQPLDQQKWRQLMDTENSKS